MLNLEPTTEDYNELLRQMPAAQERLKIIVLARMLAEKDAQIEELRPKDVEPEKPKKVDSLA